MNSTSWIATRLHRISCSEMHGPTASTSTGGSRTEIELPSEPERPNPILADEDVHAAWPKSPGFRAFWGWIQRRCDRLKGKSIAKGDYAHSSKVIQAYMDIAERQCIQTWMKLLDDMTEWVKEVPLAPQAAQRFGNLAFREYIALVEAVGPQHRQ